MNQNHLNKVSNPFNRKPDVKSGENWSSGFREEDVKKKTLKNFKVLYLYIAQGQGQVTPPSLILTKTYYFNNALQVSAISLK